MSDEPIMVSLAGEPGRAGGVDRLLPADIARKMLDAGTASNPRDRFGKPLPRAPEPISAAMKPGKRRGGYETK